MGYLLDTNIVSASLKQNVKINLKLEEVSSLEIDIVILVLDVKYIFVYT